MNPKVSIIIPVYKAEKYIDECIESILGQDYEDIEVVLVDDGSPDRCPEICDEYALKDTRIKVIHKPNSGPGLSRNAGLYACRGEYVTFVDSDDKLDGTSAISGMVTAAEKNEADVVVGCFRRFGTDHISEINHHHLKNTEDTDSIDFRFRGFYQYGHLAYGCMKLYRKKILTDNRLKQGNYPITEDKEFNMQLYACKPKYYFLDSSVYCYRVTENSLTTKYVEDYISVWTSMASDFESYLKKNKVSDKISDLSAFHIYFGSFFLIKQELQAGKSIGETARKLKQYAEVPIVNKMMKAIIARDYTKGIRTKSWRWVIWGSSLMFNFHLYRLFTAGVALIRKLGVDEQITRRRYKKGK